ncbi:MAG TPA: cache domain-containing protein, partial [Vicinamibacterales bacterium]|nr:cache domain-containing protein [Vicinamibacterales bacterium]
MLVLSGGAFVMACLVGWAFLKCSLMGVQQRLGRHDAINLLASGLFGVALATILLLTVNAYSRLSADVDAHLDHLASEVDKKFTSEIEGAAHQLATMVGTLQRDPCSSPGRPRDACQGIADTWVRPKDRMKVDFGYRDFITFAMVDELGEQTVKAAFSEATLTKVKVDERAYYQRARARDQLWSLPAPPVTPDLGTERLCPNGCYLQYLWSWNTGRPQVVMSMPTGIDRLPVATLSIPMHALLAPVLPPGFEFAVVDSAGIVQFHSDPQRNGVENLLFETDQNARLRSLLAARSAGTFNVTYWGYPYRGYMKPTRIPGWSVVAFSAKQTTRTLVLEWFIVATLLAGLYTFGWVVVMLLALHRSASWLWPDPLRRHWYVPLGCLAVLATTAWLVIAARQPIGVTAMAGIAIPLLTWAVVYVVLAVRPAGAGEVKQWTELCRNYRLAGTALFVLTAAVPAASFYALSFDRHIEAFVKERQIGLAHRITGVIVACKDVGNRDDHVVRYVDQDHDGQIACVKGANVPSKDTGFGSYLHAAFEDFVPYFTSASVALRELMHQKSDDGTWFSHRSDGRRLALQLRAGEDPESRLQVATALPAIVGWRGTLQGTGIVLVAVVALLLLVPVLGAAYFVITFLLRRVLLADVVEPIRRRLRIVTQVGQHLQITC